MTAAILDALARDLLDGAIVPWLGPGLHAASPFPASPPDLAGWLAQRSAVPGRIRKSLGSAAQYIEQHRHRRTLDRLMAEAFARPAEPPALLQLLAALPRLPLVVDTWYDATAVRFLAAARPGVGLVHGLDRTGQLACFHRRAEAPELVAPGAPCETLVYQPAGTAWPSPTFLVSDADLVEVLTEIDIQTPIPAEVQELRKGRRFFFAGQRFAGQLDRILARQITKRSGEGHLAVLTGPLHRNEERFLARSGISLLALSIEELCRELAERLAPAGAKGAKALSAGARPAALAGGLAALRQLSKAEDFFDFFALPYDPQLVQVYRLHVLKRFALEMERIDREQSELSEPERLDAYAAALRRSHDVFIHSTAQDEKLFKVFKPRGLVTLGKKAAPAPTAGDKAMAGGAAAKVSPDSCPSEKGAGAPGDDVPSQWNAASEEVTRPVIATANRPG